MTDFVSGDTGSTLAATCVDETGNAVDLTNAQSVKIRWLDDDGDVQEKDMTVDNASEGKCSYKFAADELFDGGMGFEIEITDVIGDKISNVDLINVTVRKALG